MQLLEAGEAVVATARNPANAPLLKALTDEFSSQLTVVKLDTADAESIKVGLSHYCRGIVEGYPIIGAE